jgi:hypothetical protein
MRASEPQRTEDSRQPFDTAQGKRAENLPFSDTCLLTSDPATREIMPWQR